MKFAYYPGCTLRTKAKEFNESVKAVSSALGIELEELPGWTCCGAVIPLVTDNVMNLIAPIRNIIYARNHGHDIVTLCSFCYNVLKRANKTVKEDPEKLQKINDFIEEEKDYDGSVKVIHLLEVLRDKIGFESLGKKVKRSLGGLRVAPYYGCMLLRPAEVGIDDPEDPRILENFLESLGCDVVDFPFKTECCGSYLTVSSPDTALECSYNILNSAVKNKADVVVTSCPLCHFNLDEMQEEMVKKYSYFKKIPVTYFTRPLEVALGMNITDRSERDFIEVLRGKNLLK